VGSGTNFSAELRVRPCRAADLEAVRGIYAHYVLNSTATFEEVPPALGYWEQRLTEIDRLGLPFRVGEIDDRVIGYSFCSPWRPRPGYRFTGEDSVYLAPDAVGRGFGRRLLADVLAGSREAGVREIVAVIASGGTDASLRLHRRLGFRDVGTLTRVGFKFGGWLDTHLLQLSFE